MDTGMTTETNSAGFMVATPDEGMRLYNEADSIVADGAVSVPDEAALANWSEISEAEAAVIKEDLEAAAKSGFEIPEGVYPSDEDSVGEVKGKMTRMIRYLNAKMASVAVALMATLPLIGASVDKERLNDVQGTDEVVTAVDFAGIATTSDVAVVSSAVGAMWSYVYGDSVWLAVTNYMRTVEGVEPSLQLWEVRDGSTNCVYSSAAEITNFTDKVAGELARLEVETAGGLAAARAWSRWQSGTGAANGDTNTTVITTASVLLTGGGEFGQYLDSAGNCLWVLQGYGASGAGLATNGAFIVRDPEGGTAVEIARTQAQVAGAIPSAAPSVSEGVMSVSFHANAKPTLYTSPDLSTQFMAEGTDPQCSVEWSDGGDGTWTAKVSFISGSAPKRYFAYAHYEIAGGAVVRTVAPLDAQGGILCTDGLHKVRPVYANGAISWEVVE